MSLIWKYGRWPIGLGLLIYIFYAGDTMVRIGLGLAVLIYLNMEITLKAMGGLDDFRRADDDKRDLYYNERLDRIEDAIRELQQQ
jgi:hypothetical protein